MRRFILPILFGVVGCAVLVSLGLWQVERLAWKQALLNEIDARTLAKVIEFVNAHKADDRPRNDDDDGSLYEPTEWDKDFFAKIVADGQRGCDLTFKIVLAANYLGLSKLVGAGCDSVASMLRGWPANGIMFP